EAAYLLLADIEEAQTGDQGKIRQWLGMALRAPRDLAWVADGYVAERWAPVSPVSGKLDAFEWKAPSERLGQLVEAMPDAPRTPPAALPPVAPVAPPAPPLAEARPAPKPVVIDAVAPAQKPMEAVAAATAMVPPAPIADFAKPRPVDAAPPLAGRLPD